MIDVLVVGGGPTGMALAAALLQQGRQVVVVDKQAEGTNTSRAAVVHAFTLENLARIGVADRLVGAGSVAPLFTIRDRDKVLVPVDFSHLPTEHPYSLMIPQQTTEAILLDRLRELGGEIRRPVELTGLAQHDDGVTATLSDGSTLDARYIVGADGMHSTVRALAGIGFGADEGGEAFVLADVTFAGDLPLDEVILFFSRSGMMVSAPLPDGSVRIVAAVDDAPADPEPAYIQDLLDQRGPTTPVEIKEVVWGSRFRVHHRVADNYRAGRVLLVGDAAHVHSPAGGQGMNLGLVDALVLADTVGRVLDGAPDTVLDGYNDARRPVAAKVVEFAHRLTRLATAPAAARPVRNLVLGALGKVPAFRRMLARRLSGLVYR